MKKSILILVFLGILVALPNLVLADCADLGSFTSFSMTDNNRITIYSGNKPFLRFDVQGRIDPTSKLQFINGYVCDGNEILVDGFKSTILNVTSSTD
jgi:hypothetical protein